MSTSPFESFAAEFVRAYWETVKKGRFPMPPEEPVEVTDEEILATVSYTFETEQTSTCLNPTSKLRMSAQDWAWWDFRFQMKEDGWRIVSAAARSLDDARPHDLLDTVYGQWFEPFIRHVTELANQRTGN